MVPDSYLIDRRTWQSKTAEYWFVYEAEFISISIYWNLPNLDFLCTIMSPETIKSFNRNTWGSKYVNVQQRISATTYVIVEELWEN